MCLLKHLEDVSSFKLSWSNDLLERNIFVNAKTNLAAPSFITVFPGPASLGGMSLFNLHSWCDENNLTIREHVFFFISSIIQSHKCAIKLIISVQEEAMSGQPLVIVLDRLL